MMETAEVTSASTKLVGIIRLLLTEEKNENQIYDIPGCIYDLDSPINILVIPELVKCFNDSANFHNPLHDDGTTVKSGATKSHFIWYHSRREHHFMHGASHMPELHLYAGHGYFNALCTSIHKLVGEKVHYAFSSAFSINPHTKQNNDVPTKSATISYDHGELDNKETLHEWYHAATNKSGATNINS